MLIFLNILAAIAAANSMTGIILWFINSISSEPKYKSKHINLLFLSAFIIQLIVLIIILTYTFTS